MGENSIKFIVVTAVIGAIATIIGTAGSSVVQTVVPSLIPNSWYGQPKPAKLIFAFRDPAQPTLLSNMQVEVDCGDAKVEAQGNQGRHYHYQVNSGQKPADCRVLARDESHEPIEIKLRVAPGDLREETVPLARRIVAKNPPDSKTSPSAPSLEISRLALEYDSVAAQFQAVRSSMVERIKDLGGQPVKPELQAAMDGGVSHLLAAKQALTNGHASVASQRIEQVKRSIQLLSSI